MSGRRLAFVAERHRHIKELVLQNFRGLSTEQVLERMVELSLYTEEEP